MSREAGHLEQGEIQLSRGQKFSKAISEALRLLDGKDSTAILSVALLYTLLDFGLDMYFNLFRTSKFHVSNILNILFEDRYG